MAKQPYIPFYLGDYLKDTRILPLNVRGGWVDLILYMWDNSTRGELTGTYDDFARLMTCSKEEAVLVIQTLNQKKIFDYSILDDGQMKIESRKMKSMVKLSETRKKAGLEGGNPALVKQKNKSGLPKTKQNTEYEYKDEIRNIDKYKESFESDYITDGKVCKENDFNPKQLEKAKFEFWNSKELDSEMLGKSFQDVQLHFLRWCRMNKKRLKEIEKPKEISPSYHKTRL